MRRKMKGGAEGDSSFFWPFMVLLLLCIAGGSVGIAYAMGAFNPIKAIEDTSNKLAQIAPVPVLQDIYLNPRQPSAMVQYITSGASNGAVITFTHTTTFTDGIVDTKTTTDDKNAGFAMLDFSRTDGVAATSESVKSIVVDAFATTVDGVVGGHGSITYTAPHS